MRSAGNIVHLKFETCAVDNDLQRINMELFETLHMSSCHKDIKYQVTNGSNVLVSV